MNVSKVAQPCVRLSNALIAQRWYSTPKGTVHPGYLKVREKYKKFQVDDGVPIHLKGGPLDKVLYYTTLVGCGLGLAWCAEYYYTAAFPKKA